MSKCPKCKKEIINDGLRSYRNGEKTCYECAFPEYKTEVNIKSKYNKDEIQIHTEWPGDGPFSVMNDTINKKLVDIINLKDELVRKALIDLGWTPPKDKNNSNSCTNCGYGFTTYDGKATLRCKDCNPETKYKNWISESEYLHMREQSSD